MNKINSANYEVFISRVVPNFSIFVNILYFCRHVQPLYEKMQETLNFNQGIDSELIENLPNIGAKHLLIIDGSCKEISNSKQFVKKMLLLKNTAM